VFRYCSTKRIRLQVNPAIETFDKGQEFDSFLRIEGVKYKRGKDILEGGAFMKKLKIYIDTSVISHLQHEDAPERTKDTWIFWEELRTGKYEVVISDVVLQELEDCYEPKQTNLLNYLEEINYGILHKNDEVLNLAKEYIENEVLSRKNINDCFHIAFAVVSDCDVIVSWNFKHMVRLKTIQGVRAINVKNGYFKPIEIVQPTVIGDDSDDNAGD
jgi:predicted nucleic acid-binding protein